MANNEVVSSELLRDYKIYVNDLVEYMAEIIKWDEYLRRRESFDKTLFVYAGDRIIDDKVHLLSLKKKLGFEDGFSFLEDNNFIGFSIKDGNLIREEGVTNDDIFKIVDKWYYGFPATANHYQYEVAKYVVAIAETPIYGKYGRYPKKLLASLELTDWNGEDGWDE